MSHVDLCRGGVGPNPWNKAESADLTDLSESQLHLLCSRRSRIFLKRGPFRVKCQVDAIQWGGGVVAELFRGLRQPSRFSGGGAG